MVDAPRRVALRALATLATLTVALAAFAPDALARGGGGCIAWGTPVETPSGPVPIERLREGDLVLTPGGASIPVLGVFDVEADESFAVPAPEESLQPEGSGRGFLSPGKSAPGAPPLLATAEHPVRTAPGRYERARDVGTRVAGAIRARNLVLPPPGAFVAAGRAVHNKGCFLPETPVLLADGRQVPISSVRPGDQVTAFDADGAVVTAAVLRVFTVVTDLVFEVATEGGRVVCATAEHPFAVPGGGFRTVESLAPGDALLVWGERGPVPDRVRSVRRIAGPAQVWNLATDAPHTFVAGGVAVHNKGGGGGCFVPGTPVLLADGREVPISSLRRGDRVAAFRADGSITTSAILDVFTVETRDLFRITTEGGRVVSATAEHPFAAPDGTFRMVESLAPGDAILVRGETARVTAAVRSRSDRGPSDRSPPERRPSERGSLDEPALLLDRVREVVPAAGPALVWNITTEAPNTFFAAGLAVHNKGGGCFAPGTPVSIPGGGTRPIESLAPGDLVLSGDGAPVRVRAVAIARDDVLLVETERGVLRTTAEHPLLLARGRFRDAGLLSHRAFVRSGDTREALRVRSVRPSGERGVVYEIEVDPPHTYVAGGIVVHNKGFGGGRSYGGSRGSSRPMTAEEWWWFSRVGGGLIVLFILVAVLGPKSKMRRGFGKFGEDLDFTFDENAIAPKAEKTSALLVKIGANDTEFNEIALDQIARKAFLTLQECWEARDYAAMADLVFPDLRAQHLNQISSMIRNHEINRIRGVQILKVRIVHLRYTDRKESRQFTALIHASAIDFYEDDRTGRFLRGDRSRAEFQEFWTFQLHGGAFKLREIEQSRESSALKDENFVEFLTKDKLASAYGAGLAGRSGPAGPWTEREQLDKGTKIHRMLNFLVEIDRVWDEKGLLDRARAAAIAHHAAIEALSTEPIQDLATREFLAQCELECASKRSSGFGIQYRNLCVRKVDLVLVRNRADDGRDEFFARVKLHAQRIRTRQGHEISRDEDVVPADGLYRFQREGEEFRLAEVLRPREASELLAEENVDEDSTPDRLRWYYTQARTVGGTCG